MGGKDTDMLHMTKPHCVFCLPTADTDALVVYKVAASWNGVVWPSDIYTLTLVVIFRSTPVHVRFDQ